MPDHAISSDPAVQEQLDRLWRLSPGADILGLERITALLERLGNPHLRLPPVFHVAGTNGKGSTCAFLRAALEADGHRVHVYTSPHLVRFNERIRLAGHLIDDATLAEGLRDVLDHAEDLGASFFEVTTALAFRLFADSPADACVIEVGLGGRLDATNVLASPAACGIAQLGIDHQAFLGHELGGIAREKAGIAKSGAPILTQRYSPAIAQAVADEVEKRSGVVIAQGEAWDIAVYQGKVHYRDVAGRLDLSAPVLAGAHQLSN
ncbi:MAG TPA: bifunctional folylpolyglutamate synthase/dihydrofolate synthase, partial [Sphingobium sp.]